MTGKLALRNIKKSMSDYAVYFVTMIIGISVFYVFNAISDQTVLVKILKSDNSVIDLLKSSLSVASVVVSIVLAFLVVYASSFLMKRRKREFGVYMLLGMGKKKIAGILMAETVIIGLISLGVGLGLGIVLSQGMSILVVKLFEADMSQFAFECSMNAVVKTVIYFLVMYALVLALDLFVVGKSRLIRLLNAEKRNEKSAVKNPWICLIVFSVAVVVLSHAYWMVTAEASSITTEQQFLTQIAKGIVSTFLIFWSLSGFLIFVAKLRKKSYFKGINVFTTKEISSRVNTNVFAGSIICLLLFITICIFSTCFSINKSLNDNLKTLCPVDINIVKAVDTEEEDDKRKDTSPISSSLEEKGIDTTMFEGVVEIPMYQVKDADVEQIEENEFVFGNVMKLSDYNKAAAVNGLKQLALKDDEFIVVANYDYNVRLLNEEIASGHNVTLGGKTYHSARKECVDGFVEISGNYSNLGFTVVPDSALQNESVELVRWYYIANYNKEHAAGVDKIDQKVNSEKFQKKLGQFIFVETRTDIAQNSVSLTVLVVFLGLYLGIVFLIASSALLSLKELSQAAENREKYLILRKIGVDEKMIHRSLFRQNAIFFGLPLLLAIVHSIFGIQVCVQIVEAFGRTGLLPAIIFTAVMLLVIYAVYFVVTYRCSRRILQ